MDTEVQHNPDLALQLPTYEPWWQTREQAENAIRAEFEVYMATYLDATERLLQDRGWYKPPVKRTQAHFAWLALYQVKGLTYAEIAEMAQEGTPYSAKGVKRQIIETAKLIGIKLRGRGGRPRIARSRAPGKRGRPLGSKNIRH